MAAVPAVSPSENLATMKTGGTPMPVADGAPPRGG
jgi:hypothetical protein